MTVASILRGKGGDIVHATPEQSVADVVRILCEYRIGAVLVMDGERVAGMLSERDVVRELNVRGGAVLELKARDIMTADVISVEPTESVTAALSRMTRRRIRHLPVVDGGRVIGIVSIGDLVKARIDQAVTEAEALKDYITHG